MGIPKSSQKCVFTGKEVFHKYELPKEVRSIQTWVRFVPASKEYQEYLKDNDLTTVDGELIQLFYEKNCLEIQKEILSQKIAQINKKMSSLHKKNLGKLQEFNKIQEQKDIEIEIAKDQNQTYLEIKDEMKNIVEEKKKKVDFWS
jgi:hypothetical protein